MYEPHLFESRRRHAYGGAIGGGAVSILAHATLITVAVLLTVTRVPRTVPQLRPMVDLALPREPAPPPPRPVELPLLARVPTTFATLEIPTVVLSEIPPPSRAPFDPTRFSGVGLEAARPAGGDAVPRGARAADAVYEAAMAEELPERVSGSAPRYPPSLLDAGITGEVTVECIVDTLGRVERGSTRIARSTHRLFEEAASEAVTTWRFKPGRIGGRAVRVRVSVPVLFVLGGG